MLRTRERDPSQAASILPVQEVPSSKYAVTDSSVDSISFKLLDH